MASTDCVFHLLSCVLGRRRRAERRPAAGRSRPQADEGWVGMRWVALCAAHTDSPHGGVPVDITACYPAPRGPWGRPRLCVGGAMADNPALCHLARETPWGVGGTSVAHDGQVRVAMMRQAK